MKHPPLIIACLLMLHSASGAEPKTLEEALLNYPWEWTHAPKTPDRLIFTKDGMAKCDRFSWHWKVTGPTTALGFDATLHDTGKRQEKFAVELTFTDDFRSLEGKTPDGKYRYTGKRLGTNVQAAMASSAVPSASLPTLTIHTDANQPRIEVIKDQGPNAAEWALTPLDEAVPADIRQNLTFLREDLLDEGKKAAKSSPEAYKLASDYCDKLLAALSQREISRVQAGYSAAQADANKATSNQALDARRNHQMSWPQFSREESQRAALRESETNKADVKKQRLKVDWATRAEQMRQHLDTTYRQLREAMR